MIPARLELRGFLTYRDTQVIDFSGMRTAVIVGANGVGKSALFDAITYALFGGHRGGKGGQRAEHLMNQASAEMAVQFDFDLDGRRYRVQRTLTRRRGRGGRLGSLVSWACAYYQSGDGWPAIQETEGTDACTAWVQDTLGMTFDICCASILLRQNEPHKFLLATPARRQETLNALLNLEPYRRLEQGAHSRLSTETKEITALDAQLQRLPQHDGETLRETEKEARAAATARKRAEATQRNLQQRVEQSQQYEGLLKQQHKINEREQSARVLLGDAERIEASAGRQAELKQIVPLLQAALLSEEAAGRAEELATEAEREATELDLEGLEVSLRRAEADTTKRFQDKNAVAKQEASLRDEHGALRPKGEAVVAADDALKEAADYGDRAAALERAAGRYEAAVTRLSALQQLRQDCPWLGELTAARADQAEATRRLQAAIDAQAAAEDDEAKYRGAWTGAQAAAASARTAWEKAQEQRAAARALEDQIGEQLEERRAALNEATTGAPGAAQCSRCGATLNKEHLRGEVRDLTARMESARKETVARARKAREAKDKIEASEAEVTKAKDKLQRALAAQEKAVGEQERVCRDGERADRRCRTAISHLSDEQLERITRHETYPTAEDLALIDKELVALPRVDEEAEQTKAAADERNRLIAVAEERERWAERRVAFIPAGERTMVRARWPQLVDALEAAVQAHAGARDMLASAQGEESRGRQAFEDARRCNEALRAQARAQRDTAAQHRTQRDSLIAQVPEVLRPPVLDRETMTELQHEQETLAGAPEQLEALKGARDTLQQLKGERRQVMAALNGIAKRDRRLAAAAEAELDGVEDELAAARARESAAAAKYQQAQEAERDAAEFQAARRDHERRAADLRLLESLLGREHLQGQLVEDARIGIAEAANRELEAISNGTLRLEMRRDRNKDELELLVSDNTSVVAPIDAAFLSGSQQFRVAVALALGIGQYAGGAARGQRAVIIDEGFGSLDQDGVDAMADHLRDLSDRLERVILVTHHPAMQRYFSTGFRVAKEDGTAVVYSL